MSLLVEDVSAELGRKSWHPSSGTRLGATYFVRGAFPWLNQYFDLPSMASTLSPGIGGIVSWGGRIPAKTAKLISSLRRLPHWSVEDGYLRSVALGKTGSIPLSIVVDDIGLAVDASVPSRLEQLIAEVHDTRLEHIGRRIRDELVAHKLSKYNHLPHRPPSIQRTLKRRLLLIDQVVGDVSVSRALGSRASFDRMLQEALESGAQCVIRTHPDVMAGFKHGYLSHAAMRQPKVTLVSDAVSVSSILEVVDEVWTVSSQFGLDALLRGLPVRCYAAPFYAGWGLTDDFISADAKAIVASRRTQRRTLDQLVAAAFFLYPSYRDPSNWRPIDVFQAIELIVAEQRNRAES